MGSVHARGDTFLTFGLKALTETNTSRLATAQTTRSVHDEKNIARKHCSQEREDIQV
jgi:hypothetical protein